MGKLIGYLQYFYSKGLIIFSFSQYEDCRKFRKTLEAWGIPHHVEKGEKIWSIWRDVE